MIGREMVLCAAKYIENKYLGEFFLTPVEKYC